MVRVHLAVARARGPHPQRLQQRRDAEFAWELDAHEINDAIVALHGEPWIRRFRRRRAGLGKGSGKDRRIGHGRFQWRPGTWSRDRRTIRRILDVGVPSAVEVLVRSGSVAVMGVVARTGAGTAAVAAHTIGLQRVTFSRVPSLGIGGAGHLRWRGRAPGETAVAGFRRRHRRAAALKGALT